MLNLKTIVSYTNVLNESVDNNKTAFAGLHTSMRQTNTLAKHLEYNEGYADYGNKDGQYIEDPPTEVKVLRGYIDEDHTTMMDCYTKYEMYINYAKYIFEHFMPVRDLRVEENDKVSPPHHILVLVWKDKDTKTLERVLSSGQAYTTLKSLDLAEKHIKNLRFKHNTYDGDVIYIACFNSGFPNVLGRAKFPKNMYVLAYNKSGHLSLCDPIFSDLGEVNRHGTRGRYVNLDKLIWEDVGNSNYLLDL